MIFEPAVKKLYKTLSICYIGIRFDSVNFRLS